MPEMRPPVGDVSWVKTDGGPNPSFWAYARKALVALLVGLVAAGGTITAAVADDHVTLSEWWAIGLAVAAAVVGPAAVYATRNATKPAPPIEPAPPPQPDRLAAVQSRHPSAWAPPEQRTPGVTEPRTTTDPDGT